MGLVIYAPTLSWVHGPVLPAAVMIPVVAPPPSRTVKMPWSGKSSYAGAERSQGSAEAKRSWTLG